MPVTADGRGYDLVSVIDPVTGLPVSGGGGGSSGGSVTAPGTAGTQAQTIQGNANGVPVPVSGVVTSTVPKRATRAQGQSATSTTASTAVTPQSTQVLAADPGRTKFQIQNTGSAVIALYVNEGAGTQGASIATGTAAAPLAYDMILIPAGQLYVTEPEMICTGQINVASGTASVPYSYRSW